MARAKKNLPRPGRLAQAPSPGLEKLSVNVPHDVGQRLRRLAFEQRISESSVVEVALRSLFSQGDDAALGTLLRQRGACLRRKSAGGG